MDMFLITKILDLALRAELHALSIAK